MFGGATRSFAPSLAFACQPCCTVTSHNADGRIGNPEVDGQGLVASPTRLRIPGVRIVSLIAGGW